MAVEAVNPPLGVTEMVVVAGLPWVTVVAGCAEGDVKSGGAATVTGSAVERSDKDDGVPWSAQEAADGMGGDGERS